MSDVGSTGSVEDEVLSAVASYLRVTAHRQRELAARVEVCERRLRDLEAAGARADASYEPSEVEENAEERLCDYCFRVTMCRPCPLCGREWYCSSPCRRLRSHLHRPMCRH